MKSILICNQKGGVGKTLIADELAFLFERDGLTCNFVDMDGQGGAMHKNNDQDNAKVQIIDTPGQLNENLVKLIKYADMIIVPTRLTYREISPLETMIKYLEPYKGKKPILFVLNSWNHYSASKQFMEWFEEEHSDLKIATLSQSELFNSASIQGKSVCELKPKSTPAQQINDIYGIVKYELKIRS